TSDSDALYLADTRVPLTLHPPCRQNTLVPVERRCNQRSKHSVVKSRPGYSFFMPAATYPRILPMFYDPAFDLKEKGPREMARRACGETRGLAHDFDLILSRFQNDLRYPCLDDVARRLAFDYEDYLHRVHCVRERSWDVLSCLSTRGQEILSDFDP